MAIKRQCIALVLGMALGSCSFSQDLCTLLSEGRGVAASENGDGLMNSIWNHMRMLKKGKGVYFLRVFDKWNREFDIDLVKVDWEFNANSTSVSIAYL